MRLTTRFAYSRGWLIIHRQALVKVSSLLYPSGLIPWLDFKFNAGLLSSFVTELIYFKPGTITGSAIRWFY